MFGCLFALGSVLIDLLVFAVTVVVLSGCLCWWELVRTLFLGVFIGLCV